MHLLVLESDAHFFVNIHGNIRAEKKHSPPLPHKNTAVITCLATQGPFALTTKLIISPLQRAVLCGFCDSLPNAHTAICGNVTLLAQAELCFMFVWMFVSG